eukprot:457860-Pyramimonas_sp.AAC.2
MAGGGGFMAGEGMLVDIDYEKFGGELNSPVVKGLVKGFVGEPERRGSSAIWPKVVWLFVSVWLFCYNCMYNKWNVNK